MCMCVWVSCCVCAVCVQVSAWMCVGVLCVDVFCAGVCGGHGCVCVCARCVPVSCLGVCPCPASISCLSCRGLKQPGVLSRARGAGGWPRAGSLSPEALTCSPQAALGTSGLVLTRDFLGCRSSRVAPAPAVLEEQCPQRRSEEAGGRLQDPWRRRTCGGSRPGQREHTGGRGRFLSLARPFIDVGGPRRTDPSPFMAVGGWTPSGHQAKPFLPAVLQSLATPRSDL